jgi:hypothetical protein
VIPYTFSPSIPCQQIVALAGHDRPASRSLYRMHRTDRDFIGQVMSANLQRRYNAFLARGKFVVWRPLSLNNTARHSRFLQERLPYTRNPHQQRLATLTGAHQAACDRTIPTRPRHTSLTLNLTTSRRGNENASQAVANK